MSIQTAAPLLAFIRKTETGYADARAYDTMYGHNKITPPLTQMTLDQAIAAGPTWTKKFKSSAAGAYQFMNATLKDLRDSKNYAGANPMIPSFQDTMGYALLKRRGFEDFMAGTLGPVAFAKNLAQEWASFPVLADTQGAHRKAKRGQSYYVGDALNKALVSPEAIEALLAELRYYPPTPIDLPDAPLDVTPVETVSRGVTGWVVLAAVIVVVAIWFIFIKR